MGICKSQVKEDIQKDIAGPFIAAGVGFVSLIGAIYCHFQYGDPAQVWVVLMVFFAAPLMVTGLTVGILRMRN